MDYQMQLVAHKTALNNIVAGLAQLSNTTAQLMYVRQSNMRVLGFFSDVARGFDDVSDALKRLTEALAKAADTAQLLDQHAPLVASMQRQLADLQQAYSNFCALREKNPDAINAVRQARGEVHAQRIADQLMHIDQVPRVLFEPLSGSAFGELMKKGIQYISSYGRPFKPAA